MSATAPSKRKKFKNAYRSGTFGPDHSKRGRGYVKLAANKAAVLNIPTGVTATAAPSAVIIGVTPQANVWRYDVENSPDGVANWALVSLPSAFADSTYSIIGGKIGPYATGVIQYFRLRAVNANGVATGNSAVVSATPT